MITIQDLGTFGYHVRCIATAPAPCTFRVGCGPAGRAWTITITPHQMTRVDGTPEDTVWDQITLDGQHCGNRAGGIEEYARVVGESFGLATTWPEVR